MPPKTIREQPSAGANLLAAPAPASTVSTQWRITTRSYEYIQMYVEACGNGRSFEKVEKLTGSSNWIRWKKDMTNAAGKEGLLQVLTGELIKPVLPIDSIEVLEDPRSATPAQIEATPVDEWNDYILMTAYFNKYNEVMLAVIRSRVANNLEGRLEKCTLVVDAMRILDTACNFCQIDEAIRAYDEWYGCLFADFKDMASYTAEFNRLYENFNRLRGGWKISEDHKNMMFLRNRGPVFKD